MVTVACTLQNGLILQVEGDRVVLNAPEPVSLLNPGSTSGIGYTEVDADFWSSWATANANSSILTSGAVWQE